MTLRRSAWIRWLPPIDSASPSPVTTHTDRSGRDGGQAGRDRRGAAVDRVHPVGVHVVREARGAADPGHDDHVLAGDAEAGQEALDRVEDDVVTAPGAPAHLLVGLEVLGLELGLLRAAAPRPTRRSRRRSGPSAGMPRSARWSMVLIAPPVASAPSSAPLVESMASWITAASSAARKGSPRTWVWLSTSTRYLAAQQQGQLARGSSRGRRPGRSGAGSRRGRPGIGLRCRRWICATERPERRIRRQAAPIGP